MGEAGYALASGWAPREHAARLIPIYEEAIAELRTPRAPSNKTPSVSLPSRPSDGGVTFLP